MVVAMRIPITFATGISHYETQHAKTQFLRRYPSPVLSIATGGEIGFIENRVVQNVYIALNVEYQIRTARCADAAIAGTNLRWQC